MAKKLIVKWPSFRNQKKVVLQTSNKWQVCLSSNDRIIISIGYKTLNGECEMAVRAADTFQMPGRGMEVLRSSEDPSSEDPEG